MGSKKAGKATGGLWTPANIVTTVRVVLVPLWLLVAELLCPAGLTGATFGKFLDPIADKLVVIVALCFLLEHGMASSWVLLVIVAREFLVSGLRMVIASKGVVVAASNLGKWKTATTMVSISGLLLCMALPAGQALDVLNLISQVLLFAAVVLTAWSGVDYFLKGWKYLVEAD